MQEEIFGPLLPILTYENIEEVMQAIRQRPKLLALYLFTKNKETEKENNKSSCFWRWLH